MAQTDPTRAATKMTGMRIATATDSDFLERLFLRSSCEDFAPLGLPPEQLSQLMLMQARAQRAGYAREFPDACDRLVLGEDGKGAQVPVGRLLVAHRVEAIILVDIALLPEVQGRGLGTKLIKHLITEGQAAGIPIRLQVRSSSRALQLYQRLGFRVTGLGPHISMEYASAGQAEGSTTFGEPPHRAGDDAVASGTAQGWERHVGRCFDATNDAGTASATLVLHGVERSRWHPEHSFTVLFHGALHPVLPQGVYRLLLQCGSGTQLEGASSLFLVPLGALGNRMRYEAIFNLLS